MSSEAQMEKGWLARGGVVFAVAAGAVVAKVLFAPGFGATGALPRIVTLAAVLVGVNWVLRGKSFGPTPGEASRAAARAALEVLKVPAPERDKALAAGIDDAALDQAVAAALDHSPHV